MSGQNCKHGLHRDECAQCYNELAIPVDAYLDTRGAAEPMQRLEETRGRMCESSREPALLPCPCGKTPEKLYIHDTGQGGKWANVNGDCCGVWEIEFRTDYLDYQSDECMALAITAWNDAPRAR